MSPESSTIGEEKDPLVEAWTLYVDAPETWFQLRVVVVGSSVAPFGGDRRVGVAGGWLIVEIGSPQEGPARQRLSGHGGYQLAPTVFDFSKHPRVLKAQRRVG